MSTEQLRPSLREEMPACWTTAQRRAALDVLEYLEGATDIVWGLPPVLWGVARRLWLLVTPRPGGTAR